MEKTNIVPVYKRGDKQIIENYRPISLLPICGKILKKFDSVQYMNFFKKMIFSVNISLVSELQIYVNISNFQLYDIYTSFDCSPPLDVRDILSDISKAFDSVWLDELIYKVKCIRINGMFLKLMFFRK